MLKYIIGSKIIRSYDKKGNFINELNIIEYEDVAVDWWLISTIVLIGMYFIAHYG